ncbi:MAG TPA: DUF370 domain-containing protein [Anaerolineae bacterium]|nr:DUF370 domain-containing protein [Anaerolineae bacterium]
MESWIDVGKGGYFAADRIIALAKADSAPIRRLIAAVGAGQLVDLTFGRPCRAVAILDSGHVVTVPLAPQVLLERINGVTVEEERRRANVTAPPIGSGAMATTNETTDGSTERANDEGVMR